MSTTRRQFLKILAAISSAGVSGTFSASGSELAKAENPSYRVLPWQGDDFTLGHRLRDGAMPKFPDKVERTVDFVIVGGGMSGLATAYYLREHDFVLLEQYKETGGTSSGSVYKGIRYSKGAVCTGSREGAVGELLSELAIEPAVISPEDTSWHMGAEWHRAVSGNDRFHRELKRLIEDIGRASTLPRASDLHDESPAGRLDELTFSTFLSGYDPAFIALVTNLSRSFFCAPPDVVSASSGFFMIRALTSNSYVFDGGNSGIARALRDRAKVTERGRIETGCFVWAVEPGEKGACVTYSDEFGEIHRLACKHAVVTVPPLVALRIVPDLPRKLQDLFRKLEYGGFVVANFCMPKKILENPYQSFADVPYPFCQMVMAESPYIATGRYKPEMGSVLTVYHPYDSGAAGRARLMVADRDSLASSLVRDLCGLLGPIRDNLDEVVLTRWGHAMIVPRPGIASVMQDFHRHDAEWMTFAHSSASGGPSLEGAIASAARAAQRCLGKC